MSDWYILFWLARVTSVNANIGERDSADDTVKYSSDTYMVLVRVLLSSPF